MYTAERAYQSETNNAVYQRCLFSYDYLRNVLSGQVLEIGTGNGFGIEYIAPATEKFVTIDKLPFDKMQKEQELPENVTFVQSAVPPFDKIDDDRFDFVFCLHLIEHINDHVAFVSEVKRVLKPNGTFIVSTPNIKSSLTRNPYHIREYTQDQLYDLLSAHFNTIKKEGIFGKEKYLEYHEENKRSVKAITKWDVFNLQYRLPRSLLRIPYEIANKLSKRRIYQNNKELTSSVSVDDFYINNVSDECFDLFYTAKNL